jgi:hypothetical protein
MLPQTNYANTNDWLTASRNMIICTYIETIASPYDVDETVTMEPIELDLVTDDKPQADSGKTGFAK